MACSALHGLSPGRAARLLGTQAQRLQVEHGAGQARQALREQRLQLRGVVGREGQQARARAQRRQQRQRALGQVQRVSHTHQHQPRARQLQIWEREVSGAGFISTKSCPRAPAARPAAAGGAHLHFRPMQDRVIHQSTDKYSHVLAPCPPAPAAVQGLHRGRFMIQVVPVSPRQQGVYLSVQRK